MKQKLPAAMMSAQHVRPREERARMQVRRIIVRVVELVGGKLFLTRPAQAVWQRRPVDSSEYSETVNREVQHVRLAVVAHVYYPELLDEVLACWSCVNAISAEWEPNHVVPLHLTTVDDRADDLAERLAALGNPVVRVHVTPNRGRDIAPFVGLLNRGVFDEYDAVLKLHTKQSLHLWGGSLRRRLLFKLLAGTPRQVGQVHRLFRDKTVGMVGWRASFRRKPSWWMANEARVRSLAPRTMPHIEVTTGFFEGSMFWFRPAALTAVRSLALQQEAFEDELGQTDGTLHHAIERMFTLSAWAGGYLVLDLSGRRLSQWPTVNPPSGGSEP
jgi:lipopolysaccharide biosynthesis protein